MNLIMFIPASMMGHQTRSRRSKGLLLQIFGRDQALDQSHPSKYTPWFLIAFPRIEEWAKQNLVKDVQLVDR